MGSFLLDIANNGVQSLVNLVKNEAQYLCCFNSYVENFEQKRNILAAKHKDVKRKFQKGKGVYSFKFEAQKWEHDADDIIHVDTKIKKKLFFDCCPNCWWQYRRGKELAEKTQHIESLLERCNSNIVAGRANVLNIKYLSSQGFIHFESRESTFQDLLKALQDENCNMIGLQGLGGTGKTLMAKEVAHKLKESKLIDKFIFLVISQPPDFKKIRGELAKSLYLNLEEVKEEELSSTILSKITNMDEKLLIILDDVWEEFDLTENLGIPFRHQHKSCNLLITTRSSHVCKEMGCHMIELETLTKEEALNLFKAYASLNSSHHGFKGMPQKIVKHCGGVPIAIVAIARALKNKPISVWKDALKTLEDRGLDQNFEEAYKCLKLSYDNLKNQKAKELLLISSLFPEDFETPIKFFIKIGIGLGSFNEKDEYHLIRSEVHGAIMELIYSSLLLEGEEKCVKLHDLVREVALRIGGNNIQSLWDLEKPIKENLKYLFWKNDKFPDVFDGSQLEVLLIFQDDSENLNVTDTFFKEMTRLKVLVLINDQRGPAPSLTNSLQPLKFIQTLILISLGLGDISAFGNLSTLMTLWFDDCSIIELPKEFLKLRKLISLEVGRCNIEKNNPFEVIEMCSQLEELTFVGNKCDDEEKDAISQNVYPLRLHRYCISSEDDLSYYFEKYDSLSRYFQVDQLGHLVSDSTLKQLVGRAEVLLFKGEDVQRIWKNLVPDIVPIEKEGVMDDLIVLHLSSRPDIECLICTKNHDFDVTAFCNLAELHLSKMGVEDLCRGPLPSGFLEQLEILKLTECHKLKSILFNGNYNLCHLKFMQLEDCPELVSVFQPYTAQSLKQLEELTIISCKALEYIIVGEDGDSNQKSYCDSLFPSLKEMGLSRLPSFIGIVREYHQPMSSSMHNLSPPLSRHSSSNLNQSLATRALSWVQACCSLNKLGFASKEKNNTISEYQSLDHINPSGLLASKKWIDTAPTLMRQLVLCFCHIRKMEFADFSLNSVSTLFTLSIASKISWEELIITNYNGLKHLVTSEEDDYKEEINYCSIFPKLQNIKIRGCKDLEFLFLSTISIEIKNLESLTIKDASKLTYVVGKHHHENQNDELHFDLPSLEALYFEDVPEFISIGPKNFIMVSPSLQNVYSDQGHINSETTKDLDASTYEVPHFNATQSLLVQSLKNVREICLFRCGKIISLSTLSIAASTISLKTLRICRCHKLKCITTHKGDAHVDRNSCSIFPTLEELRIADCDELEILFVSSISVGLEKLKSLTIMEVPKLKYVVDNYQKEQPSSNQNQIDELHFNLPALETLHITNAPIMNGICSKNYKLVPSSLKSVKMWNYGTKSFTDNNMVNLRTTQDLDASAYEVPHFNATPSLLVQSLKNVREVCLVKCGNIISLSTLSIAASTISLKTLTISRCHKLQCITIHKGDAQVDRNSCSIFPTLEELRIEDCDELEILFVSSISVDLEKLKSLTVEEVPKLKYVVDNNQKEEYSLDQNQIGELHFNLPDMETLDITYAPIMNSLCSKNYKLVLSSLKNVKMSNCGVKSFTDNNMVNLRTTQEVHAATDGAPLFHVPQNILKNIRKIELVLCANLISLTTLSIASTILLEVLIIRACDQLKCIVADEGDAITQVNNNSIFPKLKQLEVSECGALEYLFPAYAFRSPLYLESLKISKAPMLKYVFGRSQHDDSLNPENQNIQIPIDFPTLKDLSIEHVPELVSIYPKNYHMRGLYLRSIELQSLPEFTPRPLNEFFFCWHAKQQETKVIEMCWQTLDSLKVCDFQIAAIFDLTYMKTEKKGGELQPLTSSLQELELRNLSDLMNICVGPKCIIRFDSLRDLTIEACKNLRVIFSASTVRRLPMLKYLCISGCEELVHIAEEDYETNADDHLPHEPCFPNLEHVYVSHCDKLKYLFSITISDILPKLRTLEISEANELEHVLIKRDEMEEMLMKNVLPQLRFVELRNLPNLISVCHGINFQEEDYFTEVYNCPKFDTSTTQHQGDPEIGNSQVEEKVEERLSSHMGEETQQSLTKVVEARAKGVSSNTLYQISPTSEKEVSIPTSDNTHSFAKIFEEEEEEQGDPFIPPVTIVLCEQTSQEILPPPSLMSSKAPTSLNQAPSSILSNASDDDDVQVYDESHPHSTNSFEGADHGDIKEEGMVQNEYKPNVEPSSLTPRKQESAYSKDQIQTKDQLIDSQPRSAIPTISQDEYSEIVEIRGEEGALILETPHPSSLNSKEEPIPISLDSTSLSRSPSTTVKIFEEEGSLITTPRHESDMKAVSALPPGKEHKTSNQGDPFVPLMPVISSEQQASDIILPLSFIPSKALTSPKKISQSTSSQSTYDGRNVQENVGTTNNKPLHETLDAIKISRQLAECGSSRMASSIYDTKNASSSVVGVKEIVDMMKLEGVEPSMLAEAFKAKPQLCLSSEDRSNELLCYSYRALLNILNILDTKSPFTITEADKRLLAKNLKDASVLGFDKDWLESIRTKVFNCDASELHQQVLKSLGNKLEANKRELANVRNQEAKATQSVEIAQKELEATHKELEEAYKGLEAAQSHLNVAQQEYANIRVRHSQLLEECQEILEQRDQYSDIIAAKLKPFGF